ncbi:ATP-binding protein [Sulfoacidibacillus thermotolerans]|nr:ATP-binding protein [Sulfoacidibacillus thermotolerans]
MWHSVRIKLTIVYLLLILFAMELIGAYFIQSLNRYFVNNYIKTITHEAQLLANVVGLPSASTTGQTMRNLRSVLQPVSEISGATVYVLDKDGIVIGTSGNPYITGQKRVDPEVTGALLGLKTEEIAVNPQNGQRYLYLAVPIRNHSGIRGAVELVAPMNSIYRSISRVIIIFATGTLLALGLTALLAGIIARTITGPITAITRTARALAGGDFNQVVTIYSNDEIGELGTTFNMLTRRLKQSMRSTEQEKRRLQAVMSTMSDGVIAMNGRGDIVLINPAAQKFLNLDSSVIGTHLTKLLPGVFTEESQQLVEVNGRFLAVSIMALYPSIGGLSKVTENLEGEGEETSGRVLVMRDVTEETILEASRKRFVADVSHELRTPLTTIKSYEEALLEGAVEDVVLAKNFLGVMSRETDRMIRLIRDLLQLSRFDSGYEVLRREIVSTDELVNRLAERFALIVYEAELKFFTEILETAWVQVDRDRIDQVLDNIVSNSLKYTPKHGSISVRAELDNSGEKVVFILKDTGVGIPAKELPHIFDRFYRVDKARSRQLGGTGLGLSIAREIIQAHDGEIEVKSEVGKGTTVIITLPKYEGETP